MREVARGTATTSSLMSERAADPHDLLRDAAWSTSARRGVSSRTRSAQPRLEVAASRGRGRGEPLDQRRERVAPRVEVGPQVLALADAHRVECVERRADGRLDAVAPAPPASGAVGRDARE